MALHHPLDILSTKQNAPESSIEIDRELTMTTILNYIMIVVTQLMKS